MKVEELVGKVAIRVKTVTVNSGGVFSERNVNASFTYTPIFIEAVENGVAYIREKPDSEVEILSAMYCDENWAPVSERFMPKVWRESQVQS